MKTKPDTKVSQTITLTIKGQVLELTKEEAMDIAAKLDEVTGRKPAPITIDRIIEREVPRRLRDPWIQPRLGNPPHTPIWWDTQPTCIGDSSMLLALGQAVATSRA